MRAVTASTSGTTDYKIVSQFVEDVRSFAGQAVTYSFWAKAGSGTPSIAIGLLQNFGSGGSSLVSTYVNKIAITTSWARYSVSFTVPSVAGKTIGAGSYLGLRFWFSAGSDFNSFTGSLGNQSGTFDIWGVQLEAGSVATPFRRNAPSLQGELAACQRYYYRATSNGSSPIYCSGGAYSSTTTVGSFNLPVAMRVPPTSIDYSAARFFVFANAAGYTGGTFTLNNPGSTTTTVELAYIHGSGVFTNGWAGVFGGNGSGSYVGFSAEL
jgi:hypothetical protein